MLYPYILLLFWVGFCKVAAYKDSLPPVHMKDVNTKKHSNTMEKWTSAYDLDETELYAGKPNYESVKRVNDERIKDFVTDMSFRITKIRTEQGTNVPII